MAAPKLLARFPGVPSRAPGEFAPSSADDVLCALRGTPRRLPSRMLHEGTGAPLFEQLTGLDDYYPSRCELRLLDAHLPAIVADVGGGAHVLEVGGDSGIRGRRLRRALDEAGAARPRQLHGATLVFVPGTIVDMLEPCEAVQLLSDLQKAAGLPSRLLVGADGTQDVTAMARAYDDEYGVTAELAKHALVRLNELYAATFDVNAFEHRAVWNARQSRMELHLVATFAHEVAVAGERFTFAPNEPLVTQYAYKHSLHAMRGILVAAGWTPGQVFTAHEQPMRLWLCEPRGV